ncbi:hypothetical protein tb265_11950 [Gemmatimonadetes bacterium T265]|nr:hypothetical protein tb265_11950 [Gemmatimonadetes bacterium T265]
MTRAPGRSNGASPRPAAVLAAALAATACALAALPSVAHAHPGLAPAPHDLWRAWPASPGVVAGLALAGAWYALGVRRAWRRAGAGRGVARWRAWAYAAGLAAIAVALLTPLDAVSDALFTAHMGQHLLLILVAAPLLAAGVPALGMLWALPERARRRAGRAWAARPRLRAGLALLVAPGVAASLHVGSVLVWHLPAPYDWALRRPAVHALEHVTLLGAAALFWWPVVRPAPRRGARRFGDGAQLLYVAAAGVPMGLLGAALTFAARPWYAGHYGTTAAWGLTPLEDQQLAGVVMWVPAGLVYLGAASALFVRWLRGAERGADDARAARRGAAAAWSLAAVCVAAACAASVTACDDTGGAPFRAVDGGDPGRGARALGAYGCGACHEIPGVAGAYGAAGPPLTAFGRRTSVAGVLPNTADDLVRWIERPQRVLPGNAMPDLGVTDREARDMAAYLYTLH